MSGNQTTITSDQIQAALSLCRAYSAAWINRRETQEQKREADRIIDREVWQMIDGVAPALASALGVREASITKTLAYHAKRTPYQERGDIVQGLAEKLLKERPHTTALVSAICRNWCRNWWEAYHRRQHIGLETPTDTQDGNPATLADSLMRLIESDAIERYESQCAASDMVRRLPPEIVQIAMLRITKGARELSPRQKYTLQAFASQNAQTFLTDGDGPLTMPTREAVNTLEARTLETRRQRREARPTRAESKVDQETRQANRVWFK